MRLGRPRRATHARRVVDGAVDTVTVPVARRTQAELSEMLHWQGATIANSRSIRTIPWVLGSTQRPVLEALCLQPLSGRHGMSPNALSRCGSAVEVLAWLPILVGHTARVVRFLEYHPADSKRAPQRANFVMSEL
jgi:hypothetical protein